MLPNQIFSLELKSRDLSVLVCLIRHKDNEKDNCFPSRSLIAKECRIDAKTVDAALKELEARSIILKKHRYRENGSNTSNLYFIANIFTMTQDCPDVRKKATEFAPVSAFQEKIESVSVPKETAHTGVCGDL